MLHMVETKTITNQLFICQSGFLAFILNLFNISELLELNPKQKSHATECQQNSDSPVRSLIPMLCQGNQFPDLISFVLLTKLSVVQLLFSSIFIKFRYLLILLIKAFYQILAHYSTNNSNRVTFI